MKIIPLKRLFFIAWVSFCCVSCRPTYRVTEVEGCRVAMDAAWEASVDSAMLALLAPYKLYTDSVMGEVIGRAAITMEKGKPESLLSNLMADMLRETAEYVLGKSASVGLINMGGLRSTLDEGDITWGGVLEILPFDNSFCLLTMDGKGMLELFQDIAVRGGEGISGVNLVIGRNGKLRKATIAGKPVHEDSLYTVATIDYLAEGNDGMNALLEAKACVTPGNAVLRDLFRQYVERRTKRGEAVTSRLENRIVVVE